MIRSQLKRDFTPQQIVQVLSSLGTDCRGDPGSGEPLIFRTVCHHHHGGGSYKLYYYPDSQRFHCYTDCNENFDLYELVCRVKECSFYQALLYIQSILQVDLSHKIGFADGLTSVENDELDLLNRYCKLRGKRQDGDEATPVYPSTLIDLYSRVYPAEWQRDHITPDTMDAFHIRYDVSAREIIIPHYNLSGQLIGIRSRTLDPVKVQDGFKYMPTQLNQIDYRHPLRTNLYGLCNTAPAVRRTGKILIAESEKSCLQCWSYYGENSFAVAVCGSSISTIQRDLVLSLGVKEVFLAFDKEYHEAYTPESDAYADKILRLASLFTPYATTYVLWDVDGLIGYKDSPTDRGKDILEALMKNKFEVETACKPKEAARANL